MVAGEWLVTAVCIVNDLYNYSQIQDIAHILHVYYTHWIMIDIYR
jgi:hypothetical protein